MCIRYRNIPGDGLDDVFREFRAVRFDALPLLCAADALIGDGIAAEFICPHLRLHIAELAAGRQNDEQHPAAVTEPAVSYTHLINLMGSYA